MRDKIIKAIRAVQALGWTVKPRISVSLDNKICCPFAAVLLEAGQTNHCYWIVEAAKLLEISEKEAWSFVSGFDDYNYCNWISSSSVHQELNGHDEKAFALGQEIRCMLKDERLTNSQNKDSIELPEKY